MDVGILIGLIIWGIGIVVCVFAVDRLNRSEDPRRWIWVVIAFLWIFFGGVGGIVLVRALERLYLMIAPIVA